MGDDKIVCARKRGTRNLGTYVPLPVPLALSCLTALASAMFSCKVGAKTAMDMAQTREGDARCDVYVVQAQVEMRRNDARVESRRSDVAEVGCT